MMLLCKKRVIHNLVNSHCHFGPVGQIGLSAGNVNAVTHVTWNLTVTSRIFSNLDILKKFLKFYSLAHRVEADKEPNHVIV